MRSTERHTTRSDGAKRSTDGSRHGWAVTLKRHWAILAMLLPGVLYFALFHYVPLLGLVIAFKDYSLRLGVIGSPWVGWDNFRQLFGGEEFLLAIRNTLLIGLLRLMFGILTPLALALLLNEVRVRWYKSTVQALTYTPYFLSWVILGGVVHLVFALDGPINTVVRFSGGRPVDFMGNKVWFIVVLMTTGVWQSAGYGAVIFLASLAGIDVALYEAAAIDGAGRCRQAVHITLPALLPTIVTLTVLNLGVVLHAGYDQIYNLYNPLVHDVADVLDTYILRHTFALDFSVATAAGLLKSGVGWILLITANRWARRMSSGEQGVF